MAEQMECASIIVDAKDENAAAFYGNYDFEDVQGGAGWPRRMFMPMVAARAAIQE